MRRIILDTNVISALFHAQEDINVKLWFIDQKLEALYLTSINLAEILFGVRKLAQGKRRAILEQWVEDIVYPNFADRIMSFDAPVADLWADMILADRAVGKARSLVDSYIGAIAKANGCAIATRNQRDFERLDLETINPFVGR